MFQSGQSTLRKGFEQSIEGRGQVYGSITGLRKPIEGNGLSGRSDSFSGFSKNQLYLVGLRNDRFGKFLHPTQGQGKKEHDQGSLENSGEQQ